MSTFDGDTYGEYHTERAAKRRQWARRHSVREVLDEATTACARTEFADARVLLRAIAPALLEGRAPSDYHGECDGDLFPQALSAVLDGEAVGGKRTYAAVVSLSSIAEAKAVVQQDVMQPRPAYEYGQQVAERYYSPDSTNAPEVELLTGDQELKATLMTGGQGSGKTTALETLVAARVDRGHAVIDLVDFLKSENGVPDIPHQGGLDDVRAGMGLANEYAEEPPDVTIIAPLSRTLADAEVPAADGDPAVRAFTIPAASLSFRQLVMLLPHVTKTQASYIHSAYQELERRGGDWTLADMAETVRYDTNAGEAVADRITNSLERTQQKPYIRDAESDLTLDWEALMQEPRAYAAVTVHQLAEKSEKLAVTSYLLDQLYETRARIHRERRLGEFPPLTTVFRELHKIAPASTAEDEIEARLEKYMIGTMADIISLMRHVNMDIVADTQKYYRQLDSDTGEMFHRVFAFSGHQPDIRQVFKTRVSNDVAREHASTVSQYPPGQCALVSGDGFQMPIQFAPPPHHHVEADAGEHGWQIRIDSDVSADEPMAAPWDATVPDRLQFATETSSPIELFVRQCIRHIGGKESFITKNRFKEAYDEWAERNGYDPMSKRQIGQFVKGQTEIADGNTRRTDHDGQVQVWFGVKFSDQRMANADESSSDSATAD